MEYLIRNFQEGDTTSLIVLCGKHAAHEQAHYEPKGKAMKLKSVLLSSPPALHCWVVVVDGNVVGYASFTFDFSTWDAGYYLHVDCIFLDEPFRGLGIGKDLMNRLLQVAVQRGCINMQWQTPAFNNQAIQFYNRLGAQSLDKKRFFINF
ncbi:GNAT family N-acetyltransferase [Chryseolinea sp. H1M3-3]|uniref:GNAT family N-acetyltransferase n=1 Tax=Chryseolinea sp. H1M3-3 TaxID=3034144 RepID=UPI0023EC5E5C|nr:GNAT family N-acetyltransferase [Chryseolinea sp. H1M3-3]